MKNIYTDYWKMCRVLANGVRLKMFALLLEEGELSVSHIASCVNVNIPTGSVYLGKLAQLGIVSPRSDGIRVYYGAVPIPDDRIAHTTFGALKKYFESRRSNVPLDEAILYPEKIFKALGNERRSRIVRALTGPDTPNTFETLAECCCLPELTCYRQFQALISASIVTSTFELSNTKEPLLRALLTEMTR